MPTTPADPNGCTCPVSFPVRCGLPRYPAGSASASLLSRPARASTRYGPLARSATQGGLCHRAPVRSLANRLSATRPNRLLSRWNLPPLATRAYGAHWAKAPARNADVTKGLAWRRAHALIECVSAGLTRGHGARAVDRDCGSVWAGAPLPTLQRIYLIGPSSSAAYRPNGEFDKKPALAGTADESACPNGTP